MSELSARHFDTALASSKPFYLIELIQTKGSTPRDAGALMIVGQDEVFGTIGGGSAEWVAVQTAREFIKGAEFFDHQTITLGPHIDQCCGGSLKITYHLVDEEIRSRATGFTKSISAKEVVIFGAGHTGLALANALQLLGLDIKLVDTRPEYVEVIKDHKLLNLALPEEAVRSAGVQSVFVITTHDHSLDFLITAEALSRGDACYVGMIGSTTKRAVLKSWMGEHDYDNLLVENLHCPIGGTRVKNKQPEIIAAMCVAEILCAIELE
ncbi:MAG: xanthine dehydrogenase accessory protein XdhC [Hyphomicrobiales bacterium]|nr:xanthine dehydrogenase accessory protein XdhC [Hyphomicrobiales bacterium]